MASCTAFPTEIETLVLYYNKTLFEQNGWEAPKTLDELTALAETIDEAGIIPFCPFQCRVATGERMVRRRVAEPQRWWSPEGL